MFRIFTDLARPRTSFSKNFPFLFKSHFKFSESQAYKESFSKSTQKHEDSPPNIGKFLEIYQKSSWGRMKDTLSPYLNVSNFEKTSAIGFWAVILTASKI